MSEHQPAAGPDIPFHFRAEHPANPFHRKILWRLTKPVIVTELLADSGTAPAPTKQEVVAYQPADNTVQVAAKRRRLNGRSRRKAAGANAKEPMKAFTEKFRDQMQGDDLLLLEAKSEIRCVLKQQRRCAGC
ncbi:hypothetical protein FN846DRAFT_1024334 [Sphaerosporella brunnea]|uniref:Uncharacterized protein n=1 Tax=Sphaerosporella brunnea TaxID=1250544 RepID=A0A5J5EKB9_9PEZI|nr:hypothetical protein FN846DRAFT_1024334 [Sphaerosporella brunnea]